jgi:hypothetical protein
MGEVAPAWTIGGTADKRYRNILSFTSILNPLRTEVYFCQPKKIRMQKNIGNFTTLLKPYNIGTHLKGIETSFQVVPLFCHF